MSYTPNSRNYTSLQPTDNLHKPRILCLHGGGVTAEIFRMQSRALIWSLPDFRLVFADGPFFCDAGPGVVPVYQDYGPFRRWVRWKPEHAEIDDDAAVEELMYSIETCKKGDAGTGPWVGIVGFSQGAKVAASLLYDQQIRLEKVGQTDTNYKFGVLLAGRSPLISLCEHSKSPACTTPGGRTEDHEFDGVSPHILRIPTIHVHGLRDPGLHLHRKLLDGYCDPKTTTLIEWDGEHRVPVKKGDVQPVIDAIYTLARKQGVQLKD